MLRVFSPIVHHSNLLTTNRSLPLFLPHPLDLSLSRVNRHIRPKLRLPQPRSSHRCPTRRPLPKSHLRTPKSAQQQRRPSRIPPPNHDSRLGNRPCRPLLVRLERASSRALDHAEYRRRSLYHRRNRRVPGDPDLLGGRVYTVCRERHCGRVGVAEFGRFWLPAVCAVFV